MQYFSIYSSNYGSTKNVAYNHDARHLASIDHPCNFPPLAQIWPLSDCFDALMRHISTLHVFYTISHCVHKHFYCVLSSLLFLIYIIHICKKKCKYLYTHLPILDISKSSIFVVNRIS